jgi:hypothetical protein
MPLALTQSQFDALRSGKPVRARGRTQINIAGMNRTEMAYSQYLDGLKVLGKIADYKFEPFNLRLADRTYYRADFVVIQPDGLLEIHETKGATTRVNTAGERVEVPFYKDDGIVKLKVAAEQFPWFQFVLAYRRKSGYWERVEY